MAASDTLPVIIGAAIGAGGAVAAQVVSSVFTAKRERGQLNWEKNRQEHEWEMRKEERFLSIKQELYSSFILVVNNVLAYINYPVGFPNGNPDEPAPALPDLQELRRLQSNIDMLAPKKVRFLVDLAVVKLTAAAGASGSTHLSRDRIEQVAQEATESWWEAYRAMRADLHGKEVGLFKGANAEFADLPPDELPAGLKGRQRLTWRTKRGQPSKG